MRSTAIRAAGIAAAFLLLTGFDDFDRDRDRSIVPPDYSPHHTKLKVLRPDGREKTVIVPEACLTPDDQSAADFGPERLPPGCANNYNLQQMVARKRDLFKAREASPAPAAPAARAAQRYIDGRTSPTFAGGVRPDDAGSTSDISPSTGSTGAAR